MIKHDGYMLTRNNKQDFPTPESRGTLFERDEHRKDGVNMTNRQ